MVERPHKWCVRVRLPFVSLARHQPPDLYIKRIWMKREQPTDFWTEVLMSRKDWQTLRGNQKPKCSDRILAALKYQAKSPTQLAGELFLSRITVRTHLATMLKESRVFRKFFHNNKTNRPDYWYSSARFPVRLAEPTDLQEKRAVHVLAMLGDWANALPLQHDDNVQPQSQTKAAKNRKDKLRKKRKTRRA
jgi:hypothetical protein